MSRSFPAYYSEIRPKLSDVKKATAALRAGMRNDTETTFLGYFEQIMELREIDKQIDRMIPSLEDFERKRKAEARMKHLWQWLIALTAALAAGVIGYYIHV